MTEKSSKNILFTSISILSFLAIPTLTMLSILFFLITSSSFYTEIAKKSQFISTFVTAYQLKTDKRLEQEIEKKLQIKKSEKEFGTIKKKYLKDKKEYDTINKNKEYHHLQKREQELEDMEWQNYQKQFSSEEKFEEFKQVETKRVEKQIQKIDDYRQKNEQAIENVEDRFEDSEDKYEDALEDLQGRLKEAQTIRAEQKDSYSGQLFEDLEILEPQLTAILNEKLIEKGLKKEIEKVLGFMSNYYQQKEEKKIYYQQNPGREISQTLYVKLPNIDIDLKVDDVVNGKTVKRHLLSEVLVDEINKKPNLNNKKTFITIFKLADSSLGEYFANQFMQDFGISMRNGLIRIHPPILKGDKAQMIQQAMLVITWSKYLKYLVAVILILLIIYVIFARVERKRKLQSLQTIFLIPSLLTLIISAIILLISRYILDYYPELFTDVTIKSYFDAMAYMIAKQILYPFIIVFGIMLVIAIFIRFLRLGLKS